MRDSHERDALAAKRDRNREQRLKGIKRWVQYIRENPPEVWGKQQNELVNAQLESARSAGLGIGHY